MARRRKTTGRAAGTSTVDEQIRHIVDVAAGRIVAAVRQDIAAEVTRLVSAAAGGRVAAAGARAAEGKVGGARSRRGRRRRRAPDAEVMERLLVVIKARPGMRTEQIRKEIGLGPDVVKPALARLRQLKKVKTRGQRRVTTYTVA